MQLPAGKSLQDLENSDLEGLFAMLGEQLISQDSTPAGLRDRVRRAKSWILAKKPLIRKAVCDPEFRKNLESQEFTVAIATLDGVLAAITGGIPVSLISAVVLKSELERVCDGY